MEYLLIGVGFAAVSFCSFLWLGLPWFIIALLNRPKRATVSVFSFSSVPAIMGARTVYEFIQGLKDEPKRGAYDEIMSTMRKLLMDIKKHRVTYPADIDELKRFVLSQLRFNIERSSIYAAIETAKFRDLAELFVLTDVMQDIYMADCKASRASLRRIG